MADPLEARRWTGLFGRCDPGPAPVIVDQLTLVGRAGIAGRGFLV